MKSPKIIRENVNTRNLTDLQYTIKDHTADTRLWHCVNPGLMSSDINGLFGINIFPVESLDTARASGVAGGDGYNFCYFLLFLVEKHMEIYAFG